MKFAIILLKVKKYFLKEPLTQSLSVWKIATDRRAHGPNTTKITTVTNAMPA